MKRLKGKGGNLLRPLQSCKEVPDDTPDSNDCGRDLVKDRTHQAHVITVDGKDNTSMTVTIGEASPRFYNDLSTRLLTKTGKRTKERESLVEEDKGR